MNLICVDGKLLPADQPVFHAYNRSYRYGDGVFETMRVKEGKILLKAFHFDRLFRSLLRLEFAQPAFFTKEYLNDLVLQLCEKNECTRSARVRLSVSRNGNLADEGQLQFVVECWAIDPHIEVLNQEGFLIDIYSDAKKHYDLFSDIKSANYLPYLMAARFAKRKRLDDALVLNTYDRIADASVANIFLIKNEKLFTPSMTEGCIAGVMRQWLIEKYTATETRVGSRDLLNADEVFLSNAIYGIRWVKQFREKIYTNTRVLVIHDAMRKEIWS